MVEFSRAALVPRLLFGLAATAFGVAAVAWWKLGLDTLRGCQLLAGLEGTASSRRRFGRTRTWQSGRAGSTPTACWPLVGARGAHGQLPASVSYYPLPFYVGLALLAVAGVLAVWPAAR
jgi:hypothetical protein